MDVCPLLNCAVCLYYIFSFNATLIATLNFYHFSSPDKCILCLVKKAFRTGLVLSTAEEEQPGRPHGMWMWTMNLCGAHLVLKVTNYCRIFIINYLGLKVSFLQRWDFEKGTDVYSGSLRKLLDSFYKPINKFQIVWVFFQYLHCYEEIFI